MMAFKKVLLRQIEKKTYTKEYAQEIVATWLLRGYLTEDEADEVLAKIEKVYGSDE